MNKKIIILLVLALSLRLGLAYFQFSGDVKNHIVWGHSVLTSGPADLYPRHFPGFNDVNYPPVAVVLFGASVYLNTIIIALFNYLNQAIGFFPSFLVPLFSTENMQAAFLKLPAIFADLGIGYLIFRLAPKNKYLLSSLYLFNPAVFYISAVWGQIESLPIFFLLLSYFLLPRRYFLSHLSFTLAILGKQTALWLTPVFLILWWKEGTAKKFVSGLLSQLGLFLLIYLPFTSPVSAIGSYLSTLAGSSTSITDQAFNLWYFIFGWAAKPDSLLLLGLPVRTWSLALVGIGFLLPTLSYWKKYHLSRAANFLFLLSIVAFFLQTRVHDRHLAPAVPFLLLTTLALPKKISLYLIVSAFHLVNLYLALRLPFV